MILTGQVTKFRPRPTLGENSQSRHYSSQAHVQVLCWVWGRGREKEEGDFMNSIEIALFTVG